MLAAFSVTNTDDTLTAGTLRQAIFDANNNLVHDIITFDASLNGQTIVLDFGTELSITESLTIDASMLGNGLTIDASGNDTTPGIDDGMGTRVFDINLSPSTLVQEVTLAGLTITGGDSDEGGGVRFDGTSNIGGAIEKLTIRDSVIENNHAVNAGGGLHISSTYFSSQIATGVVIERTTISGNSTTAPFTSSGGGIYLFSYGAIQTEISEAVITGNTAERRGGGLYARQYIGLLASSNEVTISNSTISGNAAEQDGGGFSAYFKNNADDASKVIFSINNSTVSGNRATTGFTGRGGGGYICSKSGGTFNATNSTFSGNSAPDATFGKGGGLYLSREGSHVAPLIANLDHVTITNNYAADGGGLFSHNDPLLITTLSHTIVSGNRVALDQASAANNVSGLLQDTSTYNLFGLADSSLNASTPTIAGLPAHASNLLNDDPGLEPLANNGGPTLTHMPISSSDAVDNGDVSIVAPPLFDQRGDPFARVLNSQIDIGAVEYNSDSTAPKITDVILDGSGWAVKDAVSFASREQLRPIATTGVNTLTIEFDEGVAMRADGSDLVLKGDGDLAVPFTSFSHVQGSSTATWTFGTGLADAKYAIHLDDSVVDLGANRLDADWVNADNGTLDLYSDDPLQSFAVDLGDNTAGTEGGEFRFHFSLLVGDYSGNGKVGGEDYILWSQEDGTTGDPSNIADGDGDGNVNAADFGLQDGAYGDELALWLGSLDQYDDDFFDSRDFALLEDSFGSNINDPNYKAAADLDGDGDVDGFDLLNLLSLISQGTEKTAWYVPTTGSGFASALVGSAAPQVMNVIISGSTSQHSDFSFDTVDGSGSQLATVPVGGADTISIVFSEGVNVSAGSLMVIGMTTVNMPTIADFSYDTATNTATWRYEGWALGDNYLISLSDSVTDVDGNLLDGEWTNPASISTVNAAVSEFPSGDGNPGGRFNFFMTLLAGDANLDGVVNATDFGILQVNWGTTTGMFFQNGDFNGDGAVDGNDFSPMSINWGTNLQNIWAVADLDGDNDIDADDLDTITANLGMTGATWADGDLNGDGDVTQEDLDLAFLQFGLGIDLVA